jgi:hypothetical protein
LILKIYIRALVDVQLHPIAVGELDLIHLSLVMATPVAAVAVLSVVR